MTARTKARKRAVDIVFETDLRTTDLLDTLTAWQDRADPIVSDHTARLVGLVADHDVFITEMISERLVDWTWQRVAPVDRSILRVATAELLFVDDVPDAVAIDEGVELAKSLSADESPAFVNGVLGRIASDKPRVLNRWNDHRQDTPPGRSADLEGPPGVGVEDAPADESLGESGGRLVIDHSE